MPDYCISDNSLEALKRANEANDYDAIHRWVIHELKRKHSSLSAIATSQQRSRQAISNGIKNGSPLWEGIVANELGLEPWQIWESRYDEFHLPKCSRD